MQQKMHLFYLCSHSVSMCEYTKYTDNINKRSFESTFYFSKARRKYNSTHVSGTPGMQFFNTVKTVGML